MEKVSLGPFTRVNAKCHTGCTNDQAHGWQGKTHFQARKTSGQWIAHVTTRHSLRALTHGKRFARSLHVCTKHNFFLPPLPSSGNGPIPHTLQEILTGDTQAIGFSRQTGAHKARLTRKCTAKQEKLTNSRHATSTNTNTHRQQNTYHTPRKFKFKII